MNLYELFQNVHTNSFGLYNTVLIILKTYQFIMLLYNLTKPIKQRNNYIFFLKSTILVKKI